MTKRLLGFVALCGFAGLRELAFALGWWPGFMGGSLGCSNWLLRLDGGLGSWGFSALRELGFVVAWWPEFSGSCGFGEMLELAYAVVWCLKSSGFAKIHWVLSPGLN